MPSSSATIKMRAIWQVIRCNGPHSSRHIQYGAAGLQARARSDCAEEGVEELNEALREVFGAVEDGVTLSQGHEAGPVIPRSILPPYSERKNSSLTHTDSSGQAAMVDVGNKAETRRAAKAVGVVHLGKAACQAVKQNLVKKGDVLATARLAGIMAAKQTSTLIPLCHSLALDRILVDFELQEDRHAVEVMAEAQCSGKTGVEMEALTAVSVAALTIYDMCKAVSKDISIGDIRLVYKSGGQSGTWTQQKV